MCQMISVRQANAESMVEADPVMRAARNGYFVLIVVLLGLSVYEFAFVEESDLVIPALWAVGALAFYASKYYYRRQETTAGNGDDREGDGTAGNSDGAAETE